METKLGKFLAKNTDFEDTYSVTDNIDTLPCYMDRFSAIGLKGNKELIAEYIYLCKDWAKKNKSSHAMFSVTAKEVYCREWVEVATNLGLLVIEGKSRHRGRYKTWCIVADARIK